MSIYVSLFDPRLFTTASLFVYTYTYVGCIVEIALRLLRWNWVNKYFRSRLSKTYLFRYIVYRSFIDMHTHIPNSRRAEKKKNNVKIVHVCHFKIGSIILCLFLINPSFFLCQSVTLHVNGACSTYAQVKSMYLYIKYHTNTHNIPTYIVYGG